MTSAADLRAEAERLARQLPGMKFRAEASEAAHIGSAGRRRAGGGETFWQYRRYAQEDDAARIDWRRSAKGDDLYVRETELETARTVLFWADDHPGFRWKGEGDLRTKAEEAILLMLTMAIPLSREGERIGSLGTGRRQQLAHRLHAFGQGSRNTMRDNKAPRGAFFLCPYSVHVPHPHSARPAGRQGCDGRCDRCGQ
jgi:uncharacterized protein (DUF58 family)